MMFPPGSLVSVRGREWVVLPGSTEELLDVRPLAGSSEEETAILTTLEPAQAASFGLPAVDQLGDARSCRLLRDAARLSIRQGAGPFRSFAKLGVEPRSYQVVPLLLALRLDPVRLLIADDVGIGKTVEAALVAKELLERGEAKRLCVLCPPHLAEQWQKELRSKFHIDAELVVSSTAARLERRCGVDQSIFDLYPHTVVSLDYIKSDARREQFRRSCPELVIVDEAHTCATGHGGRGRQQRHELLVALAKDEKRHLILVTATPHSGKEEAFRSLLSLLDRDFANLPEDLTGPEREGDRRRLSRHLVQRRRADIKEYLQEQTPFPERLTRDETWEMSKEYRAFFEKVLDYAREIVEQSGGKKAEQRVRWWAALGLLRAIGSSPKAAARTFRDKAPTADDERTVDELGARLVLDDTEDTDAEGSDQDPGADCTQADLSQTAAAQAEHRRLLAYAKEAESFCGARDTKLKRAIQIVSELVHDGRNPILFCRFIPTAEYVAEEVQKALGKRAEVAAITGKLAPEDREARIEELGKAKARVLVCTDCLSEGINLQQHFDAVLHYDLAWNPTRHEQREGRVDRYGQPKPDARVVSFWGKNSPIDGIVLQVLLEKHKKIRTSLGVSVPVPTDTKQVIEAIFEGLLLRQSKGKVGGPFLPGMEDFMRPRREAIHKEWDLAAEREKRSQTMFAQRLLKPEEVEPELREAKRVLGGREDVQRFVVEATRACGASVEDGDPWNIDLLPGMPRSLRQTLREAVRPEIAGSFKFAARFELPASGGAVYLQRTHPFVEALTSHVLDTALDRAAESAVARRAGTMRTKAVTTRTTLLITRSRYELTTTEGAMATTMLAEELLFHAFEGAPPPASWLSEERALALCDVAPAGGPVLPEQARDFVQKVLDAHPRLQETVERTARLRADALLEAHRRVREAAKWKRVRHEVQLKPPVDWLGVYIFLPA